MDQFAVRQVIGVTPAVGGALQRMDDRRRERVVFAVLF